MLEVHGLTTEFLVGATWLRAVNHIDLQVRPGEILGLVGESGCGKSTAAYSIMRLLSPNARIAGGEIWLEGEELLGKPEEEMVEIRGSRLAMIFQDPMTSLDPVFTVGDQLVETIQEHLGLSRAGARERAVELFQQVGIPAAEERLHSYPHQFSGGMRQRIALAIAISCGPRFLIADEPTTALDVTIQAQILRLIKQLLVQEQQTGVLLITHDLGVVAQVCDRVAVMYAGEIVETGDVLSLFTQPLHPYTRLLLSSLPSPKARRGHLVTIEGNVPSLSNLPSGCPFHPRCPDATDSCPVVHPRLVKVSDGREVECVLYEA